MFQIPSSNEGLIFHSNLFMDNQWQEAVFENIVLKVGRVKSSQQRKEMCLRTTVEMPIHTFSNQFS